MGEGDFFVVVTGFLQLRTKSISSRSIIPYHVAKASGIDQDRLKSLSHKDFIQTQSLKSL